MIFSFRLFRSRNTEKLLNTIGVYTFDYELVENDMNVNEEIDKPVKFSAKVISLGRITIPEELRILHKIQDGDIVEFEIRSVQKINTSKEV